MKLWKLNIYFDDGNTYRFLANSDSKSIDTIITEKVSVVRFHKKLSLTEIDRIILLLSGGQHVHSNPRRKPKIVEKGVPHINPDDLKYVPQINLTDDMPKLVGDESGFPYCAPKAEKEIENAHENS